MARFGLLFFGVLLGVASLDAQDLGRKDQFIKAYLSETVRRGLPLLADQGSPSLVPYWPALERSRLEAMTLEPGADVDLVGSWIDLQQGVRDSAAAVLKQGWPKPALTNLSSQDWGEALFEAWDPRADSQSWTQAWLGWEEKAYSPRGLIRGLEVLEQFDGSAVVPLLAQALELHSDDRRFLPLVVRNPDSVASADALVTRDRSLNGGWSDPTLRKILDRSPAAKELLLEGGYTVPQLSSAQALDYATWLASDRKTAPSDGEWTWDADQDGLAESRLVFTQGALVSWTREADGSLWCLSFTAGQPDTLTETRGGSAWKLNYEAYPLARSLEYRWGDHRIVYRFRPLAQKVPLWPSERFDASANSLPSVLADLWAPLDPKALAAAAASVETWDQGFRQRIVFLFRGQVWLSIEDTNNDGRDDTWSYYRSGKLVSVYRDIEGHGQTNVRELYQKGELTQVQSKAASGKGTEFVLFPNEGVQLWDTHGDLRPLERIFVWPGDGQLVALVFTGSAMPWSTMPPWEPRP